MSENTYPWGDKRRFNSYANYFRKHFGSRVQKLSVNAGFSCPNRDGNLSIGGCTFCSNDAFTPSYCQSTVSIREQLITGINFHERRYRKAEKYLAYFQSFSNTYAPLSVLKERYSEALEIPGVIGLIIGTRPDCIDEEKLDYLAQLAEDYHVTIEYGIESTHDETLTRINRGHDFAVAEKAVKETAARAIHCGAHFILGLPGETRQMLLQQIETINALPLNSIKFHQLQIFQGTAMADEYQTNPDAFQFYGMEQYIDFVIDLLERMRPDIILERFASEAPPRFQAGPTWGSIRNEQLLSIFEKRLKERNTWQGKLFLK